SRRTRETHITVRLDLDGCPADDIRTGGDAAIDTGIGFLDHLLTALAQHAGFGLSLTCRGDLQVDDHHTVEDCALCLGAAFDQALGERTSIVRFGWALAPLDEALARAAVDLATRPSAAVDLNLRQERLGGLACQNLTHFFHSFAQAGRFCCHLDVLKGINDHHQAEAAVKALALALHQAVAYRDQAGPVSTKGVL
ncbi:MAG: imidazoleglycerol-phosphate dehydratase, partial [bacterium]